MNKVLFKKIYNAVSIAAISILLGMFFLAIVSMRSLPGSPVYPLKIASEQVVLFLSQINPKFEMDMRLVVLNRRYHEALELLEKNGSPRGYKQFTEAASRTQRAVLGIGNNALRQKYQKELAEDLRRYDAELKYLIKKLEQTLP